jgi:ComF family protein
VPICDLCWAEIPLFSGPACACCGDTLDRAILEIGPSASSLCRACRISPPDFIRAVAFGFYHGRMKEAIHALKYERLHPAARTLGRMLAEAIRQFAPDAPPEMLVVPIPLHRSKQAQRGFNQARALAVHALAALQKSHPAWRLTLASSTLMRLRATESQASLSPHERRINLRGAFTVSDPALVTGKHILLIDDILTTGATARSAARELARAGAASVYVATLARARRLSSAGSFTDNFDDETDDSFTGLAPGAILQQESIHSSHGQTSF